MVAQGGFNLGALSLGIAGGVLAYSGVRGKHISSVLRSLLAGNTPGSGSAESGLSISLSDSGSNAADGTGQPPSSPVGGNYNGPDWMTKQYSVNGSETLSYSQWKQTWIAAGGPTGVAVIAAAITMPEAGRRPGAKQLGEPYGTTGWGGWQITPGDSEPQYGTDEALLVPINNGRAAVAKFKAAGNSFRPWTTFTSGKYTQFLGAAQNG